jgi:transposase
VGQEDLLGQDDVVEVARLKEHAPTLRSQARLNEPVRSQLEWIPRTLDSMLPEDHRARAIWAMVQRLELKAFYAPIKAVEGHAGHPATDPQVLLALWLYATTEGVGSARQLDRLCAEHDAYRWLRGEVPVNYHTLADFRVGHQEALNELFTDVLGSMMAEGLVSLRHVAQDGIRIRASAGGSSFRRKETLEKCLKEARAEVERLALEREHPDPGVSQRERAARERAARERQERVEAALRRLPEIEASKERQRKTKPVAERGKIKEARTSTTDAEATVMRMPGGGSQPGFNGELASDVDSQVIVGVGVVTKGTDGGQAAPMAEQIEERTGKRPGGYLMDGGFVTRPDITTLEKKGITVYAPSRPPRTKTSGRMQGDPRPGDTPEVAAWRQRMETEEAKKIYKERAATAECVNAHVRRYGLRQLVVRGTAKVLSVLLLVALTHNILRWVALTN